MGGSKKPTGEESDWPAALASVALGGGVIAFFLAVLKILFVHPFLVLSGLLLVVVGFVSHLLGEAVLSLMDKRRK